MLRAESQVGHLYQPSSGKAQRALSDGVSGRGALWNAAFCMGRGRGTHECPASMVLVQDLNFPAQIRIGSQECPVCVWQLVDSKGRRALCSGSTVTGRLPMAQ